ncbi:sodium:solute symporter [Alkalihalobacillus sp. BA299]|uniref:sodium:solute symporter family protein n=1 Tax=Alkalihalobacillus sp. BA299 TaxID=2815938 RepID=UPI001AD9867D|nr:sodium/solute symporter [Alkalihalobacillus sp. BA299]
MNNDIVVLTAFFAVIALVIAVSLIAYLKIKNANSFFLAERKAKWYLILGSLMASTISGAAFFGMQAYFYNLGASVFWILLGCSWGFFIMCFFVGPKLRRFGMFTIPEYLAERFDSPLLKPVFSLLVSIWMVILMGTLYVQGGLLFENMFGLNYATSIFLIGLITIVLTIFGGMVAVLNSDFIAMFILLIVTVIGFPIIMNAAGGWGAIVSTVQVQQPDFFTNTSNVGFTAALSWLIIWSLGYLGHPGFLTRFYTAENEREIVKAGIGISVLYLPFWIFIFMIATAAKVLYPSLTDTETIWMVSLYDLAPSIIIGLGMAAIFVGILSSVNTWLLTAATSLTRDIYQTIINPQASEKNVLFCSKTLIFLLSVLAIPIGIWRPGYIIEMMNIAYAIAGSAGGVVILLSMYYKGMTKQGAWSGIIAGASIAILWRLGTWSGLITTNIDPIIPTLLITLILIIVVSKLTEPSEKTIAMYDRLQSSTVKSIKNKVS